MTAPSDFNSIPELDATLVFAWPMTARPIADLPSSRADDGCGRASSSIETLLRRPIDLTCGAY